MRVGQLGPIPPPASFLPQQDPLLCACFSGHISLNLFQSLWGFARKKIGAQNMSGTQVFFSFAQVK